MKKYILAIAIFFSSILPAEEKEVKVYVDVVGDLFHAGHVNFFKQAKAFGNYLIVGVVKDDLVTSYKRKPIMSNEERVSIISSCKYVDEVVADAPLGVTEELLNKYNIDLVVHGDDFDQQQASAQYLPAIERGIFRTVAYTKGVSTSEIISRIRNRDAKDLAKKDFFQSDNQ